MWSGQKGRKAGFVQSGQSEYHRGLARHSSSDFNTTVVSNIENGAGSVDVSARPALPKTLSTSGKARSTLSWAINSSCACATEMPGSVVGM